MEVRAEVAYKPKQSIGAGQGRSSVVLAEDPQLGRDVAIKEIDKTQFRSTAEYFDEAKALYSSRHRNVAEIIYAAETASHVILAMPPLVGSLASRVRQTPVSTIDLINIAQDVCAGVEHVHHQNLIHLDLKPANVLFDGSGNALVADFGQSLPLNHVGVVDPVNACIYTAYWPPEKIKRVTDPTQKLSALSDVYQLGVTFYRALNGEQWFRVQRAGKPLHVLHHEIVRGTFPSRAYLPHVPTRIRAIINRAMAVLPADRHEGANAIAEELASVRVKHDWRVVQYTAAQIRWELVEPGSATVIVDLVTVGKRHDIRVHTQTGSDAPRRRGEKTLWASGLTWKQAQQALTRVFRRAPR